MFLLKERQEEGNAFSWPGASGWRAIPVPDLLGYKKGCSMKAGGSKLLSKGPLSGTLASPTTSKKCRILGLIPLFFWLCWVFIAACRLSLLAASVGWSSLWICRLLVLWSMGLVGSSPTRDWTKSPALAGGLTAGPPGKASGLPIGSPGDSGTLKLEKHWFQEFS